MSDTVNENRPAGKHTPRKLYVVRNSAFWEVNPEREWGEDHIPYTVADVCASDPGDTTGLQEANARRIVAAWNACDGIPTEALEAGVVNDLLKALLEIADIEPDQCNMGRFHSIALAAIAKAGGAGQ